MRDNRYASTSVARQNTRHRDGGDALLSRLAHRCARQRTNPYFSSVVEPFSARNSCRFNLRGSRAPSRSREHGFSCNGTRAGTGLPRDSWRERRKRIAPRAPRAARLSCRCFPATRRCVKRNRVKYRWVNKCVADPRLLEPSVGTSARSDLNCAFKGPKTRVLARRIG